MTEPLSTRSSGNVFADMDLPDADELLEKAHLALKVKVLMREQGIMESELARRMGLDEAVVSMMLRGRLSAMSVSRLTDFVRMLESEEAT